MANCTGSTQLNWLNIFQCSCCSTPQKEKKKIESLCVVQVFGFASAIRFSSCPWWNCLYLIPIRVTLLRILSIKSSIEMEMFSSLHTDGNRISIHGYLLCSAGHSCLECVRLHFFTICHQLFIVGCSLCTGRRWQRKW